MQKCKSRKAAFVNNQSLVVGVDVVKNTHFARFVYPDGSQSKSFSFANSQSGFETLVSLIVLLQRCLYVNLPVQNTNQ